MSQEGIAGAYEMNVTAHIYDVSVEFYGKITNDTDWKMPFQILLYDTFKGYADSANLSAITDGDRVTLKFVISLVGQRLSHEQMSARLSTRLARYPVGGLTVDEVSEIRFEPYRKRYITE